MALEQPVPLMASRPQMPLINGLLHAKVTVERTRASATCRSRRRDGLDDFAGSVRRMRAPRPNSLATWEIACLTRAASSRRLRHARVT